MTRRTRTFFAVLAGLALPFSAACADEDGDGATTDEEVEDLQDGTDEIEDQVEEEIDGQDDGTNEDGE